MRYFSEVLITGRLTVDFVQVYILQETSIASQRLEVLKELL